LGRDRDHARVTHEAAVPRRVSRALSRVRRQSEPDSLYLPATAAGSPPGRPQGPGRATSTLGETACLYRNDAIPRHAVENAAHTTSSPRRRVRCARRAVTRSYRTASARTAGTTRAGR